MISPALKLVIILGFILLQCHYHKNDPQVNYSTNIFNRGQFHKEIELYFTSRTLVLTNSHQFKSTKSLYKFPLEASNLYLQWYSIGFNQL